MKKYIIKNCPARSDGFCGDDRKELFCIDVSDCLLKQIVELCKKSKYKVLYSKYSKEDIEITKIKRTAQDILNLLEIEEVNE